MSRGRGRGMPYRGVVKNLHGQSFTGFRCVGSSLGTAVLRSFIIVCLQVVILHTCTRLVGSGPGFGERVMLWGEVGHHWRF